MRHLQVHELQRTLSTLLSTGVTVRHGRLPIRGLLGHSSYSAIDDNRIRRAVVAIELPLAASFGAALAMVNPGNVSVARPDPYLLECAREVANVLVGRLSAANGQDMHIDPRDSGRTTASPPVPDVSYVVNVEGYGSGALATSTVRSALWI